MLNGSHVVNIAGFRGITANRIQSTVRRRRPDGGVHRPSTSTTTTTTTGTFHPVSPSQCLASALLRVQHRFLYRPRRVPCESWPQKYHSFTPAHAPGTRTDHTRSRVHMVSLSGAQEARAVARELEAEGVSTRYCKGLGRSRCSRSLVLHVSE